MGRIINYTRQKGWVVAKHTCFLLSLMTLPDWTEDKEATLSPQIVPSGRLLGSQFIIGIFRSIGTFGGKPLIDVHHLAT